MLELNQRCEVPDCVTEKLSDPNSRTLDCRQGQSGPSSLYRVFSLFVSNGFLDTAPDVGIFVGYYFYIVLLSPSIIRLYGRVPVTVGYDSVLFVRSQ